MLETSAFTSATATLHAAKRRNRFLLFLLDLVLVAVLSGFICFWNVGERSTGVPDEVTHMRVTQEMFTSGHWWQPTIAGKPYYEKPPFKMWLSRIPTTLLGESNFSYRFIDALSGVGTCFVLYLFAHLLFSSRWIGLIAVFTLLGCNTYILRHGVRAGVQDSFMIFLSTLALYLGWQIVSRPLSPGFDAASFGRSARKQAVLGGIAVGLAVLTKSAPGYLPLLILGVFALLSGRFRQLVRACTPLLAIVLALGIAIPALYYLPHVLFTNKGFAGLIYHPLYGRAFHGYHNVESPWFYLGVLYDGYGPPLIPLVLALIFGGVQWYRRREPLWLFLLVWACLTIPLFSISKTKLSWYIAPSFPAMALLIGAMVHDLAAKSFHAWPGWWRGESKFPVRGFFQTILFAYCCAMSVLYFSRNTAQVLHPAKKRIPFDVLTSEILDLRKKQPLQLVIYDIRRYGEGERGYRGMLEPHAVIPQTFDELRQLIKNGKADIVIARSHHLKQLFQEFNIAAYTWLPPLRSRKGWVGAVALSDKFALPSFTPAVQRIDFTSPSFHSLYGFGKSQHKNNVAIRSGEGPESAFFLEGDLALAHFGSKMTLRFAPHVPSGRRTVRIEIFLNQTQLDSFESRSNDFHLRTFDVPASVWRRGENLMTIRVVPPEGTQNAAILFAGLKIELNQPQKQAPQTPENGK